MHIKFLLSLIVNLLSTVIYSQNYDTIVFSGPFQPKLSILIEQDNYREYNIFDEKPLNAVVLNNFLEIKKIKEVYKNGWKVKNDTIITNQENELFKKAKRLLGNENELEKSIALIINKIDKSQLILFFEGHSYSILPDWESAIIFKDKNENECLNLKLDYLGANDIFEKDYDCNSNLFEIEKSNKNELTFFIKEKVILKEYYQDNIIVKRQIFFPTQFFFNSIVNIIYENEKKKEVFQTYSEENVEIKSGLYYKFHPNGKIFLIGFLNNNEPVNIWEVYNKEGQREKTIDLNDCNCKLPNELY